MGKISKTVQGLEALVFASMIHYGNNLHYESLMDTQKHSWAANPIFSLGFAGLASTGLLYLNAIKDLKDVLIMSSALTILDLSYTSYPNTDYDWQNTAALYAAPLFAYAVKKFLDRYSK